MTQTAMVLKRSVLKLLGQFMTRCRHTNKAAVVLLIAEVTFSIPASATYIRSDLVSDGSVSGTATDPDLINPWGMAASPASPFWVSDNGTGLATLYNGSGIKQGLVVTIPPPSGGTGPSRPTGQVFNGGVDFNGDRFIFATEDGTLSGWRGSLGTHAELLVDNSASGAVYKGLAIGSNGAGSFLYAANFSSGSIDVFDGNFTPVTLVGSFTDPTLPSGYAPFNIQNIGGDLYVTYALQDSAGKDDVPGSGHGYVDVFDTAGTLLRRLISSGPLNSPWGLAMAPDNFGEFSNDLLVGNSGDGRINAFNPTTGALLGTLDDLTNTLISIDGLWALGFGNGGSGGQTNELFFTAGPNDGANGLFGKIVSASSSSVPEPATLALFGLGLAGIGFQRWRRAR